MRLELDNLRKQADRILNMKLLEKYPEIQKQVQDAVDDALVALLSDPAGVVITMEGGVIQDITTEEAMNILVIDFDHDSDLQRNWKDDDRIPVTQKDGSTALAHVHLTGFDSDSVDAESVKARLKRWHDSKGTQA